MHVEAFIALQADQPGLAHRGERLRDLGLADPGIAFEQQGPSEILHQQQGSDERRLGDIAGAFEVGLPGGELLGAWRLHQRP